MIRVLAVMRSYFDAQRLRQMLPWNQLGYSIDVNYMAVSSLDALWRVTPDIVILQDKLLHLTTERLCESVRNYSENVPVIVLYDDDAEDVISCPEKKVYSLIDPDPETMEKLLLSIRRNKEENGHTAEEERFVGLLRSLRDDPRLFRIAVFRNRFVQDAVIGQYLTGKYPDSCPGWERLDPERIAVLYAEEHSVQGHNAAQEFIRFLEDIDSNLTLFGPSRKIMASPAVPARNLPGAMEALAGLQNYRYFKAGGKVLTQETVDRAQEGAVRDGLIDCVTGVILSICAVNAGALELNLEKLYFDYADRSLSFELLEEIRMYLSACYARARDMIPGQLSSYINLFDGKKFLTVEDEYAAVSAAFSALLKEMQPREIRPVVLRTLRMIYTGFHGELSLDAVAAELGVTEAYLSRAFKACMNCNFIDYVTQLKMSEAKILLLYEHEGITEIASRIGYGDPKYFARVFKREVGVTPTQFRKQYKRPGQP